MCGKIVKSTREIGFITKCKATGRCSGSMAKSMTAISPTTRSTE
jgi:hypothetical protein